MPTEPHALSTRPPAAPAETDYDAICAAVTATARGRWFLDEYAKRNRNSDTLEVLAAIARMEAAVVGERTQQASREAHQEVRIELLEMARAIAQARAEVAESQSLPAQQPAAEPAGAAAPDVAAAAERLRQIAWTMKACGVEVVASEQIGQIADTILSADALRNLGEQRAHKLTEALHDLEHRIDRMLDGHVAAANRADPAPAPKAAPPPAQRHDQETTPVAMAMAMIAAALQAEDAATTVAEPAPSPARTEAAVAAQARDIAPAALDATEYPMDDDVVLTVADSAIEPKPAPAADARHLQIERAELEFEPLRPALPSAGEAEAGFAELELEPLAVAPAVLTVLPAAPHAVASEDTPDEPAVAAASTTDPIAIQVDHDLDVLTDFAPDDFAPDDIVTDDTPDVAAAPPAEPAHATRAGVPVSALVADAQASRVELSDTLAAIESELFGSTRPVAPPDPSAAASPAAAKSAAASTARGPLGALAAMSEEERIALFS